MTTYFEQREGITMEIVRLESREIDRVAPLAAAFRVSLKNFNGIAALPNVEAGKLEILEYLDAGYPCFAAVEHEAFIGYIVCRVEKPTVWVESLYVKEEYRRRGVATKLYQTAENLASSYGEDTVFNFVHPNNHGMIEFLRKNGYSVLNLIELRKPYSGEVLSRKIQVGEHEFDY